MQRIRMRPLPIRLHTDSIVVKALCYKPEGLAFQNDFFFFSIYLILPAALGPGVLSASRNEYQQQKKTFLRIRARPVRRADNLTAIYEPIV
jgi:hypothetical protein